MADLKPVEEPQSPKKKSVTAPETIEEREHLHALIEAKECRERTVGDLIQQLKLLQEKADQADQLLPLHQQPVVPNESQQKAFKDTFSHFIQKSLFLPIRELKKTVSLKSGETWQFVLNETVGEEWLPWCVRTFVVPTEDETKEKSKRKTISLKGSSCEWHWDVPGLDVLRSLYQGESRLFFERGSTLVPVRIHWSLKEIPPARILPLKRLSHQVSRCPSSKEFFAVVFGKLFEGVKGIKDKDKFQFLGLNSSKLIGQQKRKKDQKEENILGLRWKFDGKSKTVSDTASDITSETAGETASVAFGPCLELATFKLKPDGSAAVAYSIDCQTKEGEVPHFPLSVFLFPTRKRRFTAKMTKDLVKTMPLPDEIVRIFESRIFRSFFGVQRSQGNEVAMLSAPPRSALFRDDPSLTDKEDEGKALFWLLELSGTISFRCSFPSVSFEIHDFLWWNGLVVIFERPSVFRDSLVMFYDPKTKRSCHGTTDLPMHQLSVDEQHLVLFDISVSQLWVPHWVPFFYMDVLENSQKGLTVEGSTTCASERPTSTYYDETRLAQKILSLLDSTKYAPFLVDKIIASKKHI